jgi:hypothetical protein
MSRRILIERQLRHLVRRDRIVIAGQAVRKVSWNEYRIGDDDNGEALLLLVTVDRLAAAARKLREGST